VKILGVLEYSAEFFTLCKYEYWKLFGTVRYICRALAYFQTESLIFEFGTIFFIINLLKASKAFGFE